MDNNMQDILYSNEYSAKFNHAEKIKLNADGSLCRPAEELEDFVAPDFHFPDFSNFLENVAKEAGVGKDALALSMDTETPGVVEVSFESEGYLWAIYYDVAKPAEEWMIGELLDGKDCSRFSLSLEHLFITAVPVAGPQVENVVEDDLADCDFSYITDLTELKNYAGGDFCGDGSCVVAYGVPGAPGVLRLDYEGNEDGELDDAHTHDCALYARVLRPLYPDEV